MQITANEWEIMEGLEKILKLYEEFTEMISGSMCPTISMVYSLIRILMHQITTLKEVAKKHPELKGRNSCRV